MLFSVLRRFGDWEIWVGICDWSHCLLPVEILNTHVHKCQYLFPLGSVFVLKELSHGIFRYCVQNNQRPVNGKKP